MFTCLSRFYLIDPNECECVADLCEHAHIYAHRPNIRTAERDREIRRQNASVNRFVTLFELQSTNAYWFVAVRTQFQWVNLNVFVCVCVCVNRWMRTRANAYVKLCVIISHLFSWWKWKIISSRIVCHLISNDHNYRCCLSSQQTRTCAHKQTHTFCTILNFVCVVILTVQWH